MKYLKTFNESNSVILHEPKSWGAPIIGYEDDIKSGKTNLMDGYFTGTAFVGSEDSDDKGVENYSSPFHKGQVIDNDDLGDVEEIDFKYCSNLSTKLVREYLDKYVSDNYSGKIVKITFH